MARRAYATSNPLSAPAWSLRRIAIDYEVRGRRRFGLISPVRREEFMESLRARAALEWDGSKLVRPIAGRERE